MTAPKLDLITAVLESIEETIITKLIDRAQFRVNAAVYQPGLSGFEGADQESLLDLRLRSHEEMDAVFGRFCIPEERPFTHDLPSPRRRVTRPSPGPAIDDCDVVNLTERIRSAYLALIPRICRDGDDGQYGSSVEHDVYAMQAIARRVHYGALYVAECKYADAPESYRTLAEKNDKQGLFNLLTRKGVEESVLERVRAKIAHIQAQVNPVLRHIASPDALLEFYRDHIIPLTKEGQGLYLLNRRID